MGSNRWLRNTHTYKPMFVGTAVSGCYTIFLRAANGIFIKNTKYLLQVNGVIFVNTMLRKHEEQINIFLVHKHTLIIICSD